MKLRPALLAAAAIGLALPCLVRAAESAAPAAKVAPPAAAISDAEAAAAIAELTAQATLADALLWLQERYPVESLLSEDPEFYYAADDVVEDWESGLLLFAYRSRAAAGSGLATPSAGWLAWLGVDADLAVVLIDGVVLPPRP